MRLIAFLTFLSLLPFSVQAHAIYTNWTRPGGGSCCSNQDCSPVAPSDYKTDGDHRYIRRYGTWVEITPDVILPFPSPDGQLHACMSRPYHADSEHGAYDYKPHLFCVAFPANG